MKSVTIHAAKTHLSALIEDVRGGEDVVISKGKEPVARLIPFAPRKTARAFGAMKGRISVEAAFFEPLPDDELAAWEG